jgi:hypothetical protein
VSVSWSPIHDAAMTRSLSGFQTSVAESPSMLERPLAA